MRPSSLAADSIYMDFLLTIQLDAFKDVTPEVLVPAVSMPLLRLSEVISNFDVLFGCLLLPKTLTF